MSRTILIAIDASGDDNDVTVSLFSTGKDGASAQDMLLASNIVKAISKDNNIPRISRIKNVSGDGSNGR